MSKISLIVVGIWAAAAAITPWSRAEAQEGLSVGVGGGFAGSEPCFGSLMIGQEFGEFPWLAYLVVHGSSSACAEPEPVRKNFGVGIIRTVPLGRWSIGVGAGLLEHGDIIVGPGSIRSNDPPRVADRAQLVAALLVRRLLGDRLVFDILHNSTGGASEFKRGFNAITIGVRFR